MTKTCSKCKMEKPKEDFYKNSYQKDGLDNYCKKCKNEQLKSYKEKNAKNTTDKFRSLMESMKEPCRKCGESRPYVIQFHHVNPNDKLFQIAAGRTKNETVVRKEISKCVCLCSNCHIEFHHIYGKRPENPVEALLEYLNE